MTGDLAGAADVLNRAAYLLERRAAGASDGRWQHNVDCHADGLDHSVWAGDMTGEYVIETFAGNENSDADAEFIATVDPRAVAALVPVLREAADDALAAAAMRYPPDRPWTGCDVVLGLAAFAALLLGEEETP